MKYPLAFGLAFILTISIVFTSTAQTTIAAWNFESFSKNPSQGNGTLTLIGGVTEDWTKTGIAAGLSVAAGLKETLDNPSGVGLQTLNYPAQATNPKTAGIQIAVSTVGYKHILFKVDVRQGGTSANKVMLQYTLDGVVWTKANTYTTDDDDTWYLRNYNFTNIPGANNNASFAVRMVTNFDDDSVPPVYVPVKASRTYLPAGPIRFDNILFRGTPLSTPDDDRSVLVGWNFDQLSKSPYIGNGTLASIGGILEDWSRSGIIPGQTIDGEGVYDYASLKEGVGLQTLNYPTLYSANKSAGINFFTSTVNYKDIYVSADIRHGNTSANNMFMQYTVDGQQWIDARSFLVNSGDSWFKKDYDFSSIQGVNNNPNFGIRYVTAFYSGFLYRATGFEKEYLTTGPIRYDNVIVKGKLTASVAQAEQNNWRIVYNNLQFDVQPESNILIYSISGSLINVHEPSTSISLDYLQSGVYIFKAGNLRAKFVK